MKKLALTIAIVLGLGMASFADNGGLFNRGNAPVSNTPTTTYEGNRTTPLFPTLPSHTESGNQPAPLGSGVAIMLSLGAAYLVGKKRREE